MPRDGKHIMLKTTTAISFLALSLVAVFDAHADSFGIGPDAFDIEFVDIANANNPDDTTGNPDPAGKVEYAYRMGKFEISEDMIDKANAITLAEGNPLNITHFNTGANKPATDVSWFEAATFVNWLNTSKGHTPAYKFNSGTFELWQAGDVGFNPANLFRNSQAHYFLPSMDEWYKAAYYDPIADVYYNYPTGSNSEPDGIDFVGDTTFDAVFDDGGSNNLPNDITDVGLLSPYGTAGQGGNVWELEETEKDLVNDSSSSARAMRGGCSIDYTSTFLQSAIRYSENPLEGNFVIGFRVASILEPALLGGDFDGDGDVDGTDFLYWQINDGSPAGLLLWRDNFGMISQQAASVDTVPEPSTLLLSLLVLTAVGISRRRFKK